MSEISYEVFLYNLPKEIYVCHNSKHLHVLPGMASLKCQMHSVLKSIFQDLHLKTNYHAFHEILRCHSLILDKGVMQKLQCLK